MDKITNKITVVFALLLLAGLGAFGFFKVTAYLDLYNYNKDMKAAITDAKTDSSDLASEITEAKLEELKIKARKIMNEEDKDSLIIFKSRNEKWLEKEIVGTEKRPVDNVL